MNHNKNVVIFTLVTTFIMLMCSLAAQVLDIHVLGIDHVNILSDVLILKKPLVPTHEQPMPLKNVVAIEKPDTMTILPEKTLRHYKAPQVITAFYSDTDRPSLPLVMHKLYTLKQKRTGKVRIAWLGDSMIEGDLLTQTVRKLMQQYFGGAGVGFVPANSVVANFRTSVSHKWTGDWKEENFRTAAPTAPLYFSGHTYFTANGELMMRDATVHDTTQVLEKSLICGKVGEEVSLNVNGHGERFKTENNINRLVLDNSENHAIDISLQNEKLPVYGVSFETADGVVVDNYSFRGVSGLELGKLDTTFLAQMDAERSYDLVILEYGANILYKPDDTDYSWYEKHIVQVVHKLQKMMPHSEFLIISSADRAFKYGDTWQSAVGINNLVRSQAVLAYVNNASFYNLFSSMGGQGTIVNWAEGTPQLANKDYIHPNLRGAEKLGNMFFEAFMKDYNKANRKNSALN